MSPAFFNRSPHRVVSIVSIVSYWPTEGCWYQWWRVPGARNSPGCSHLSQRSSPRTPSESRSPPPTTHAHRRANSTANLTTTTTTTLLEVIWKQAESQRGILADRIRQLAPTCACWIAGTLSCDQADSASKIYNDLTERYNIAVMQQASPLRKLTYCHTESHSATCHPAELTFQPLLKPIKAGTRYSEPEGMLG